MFTIKRIPNYLPIGSTIDNSQIGFIPQYVGGKFYSEDVIQVGGEIRLYKEFNKYIITTYHSDNIVKEYAFVSDGEFHKSTLFPIFIRTHNLNNPIDFTTSPILLKRGIVNARNSIFEDRIMSNLIGNYQSLDFTINKYLDLMCAQVEDNDILKGILSYVKRELSIRHKFYANDVLYHDFVADMGQEAAATVNHLEDMLMSSDYYNTSNESSIISNLIDTFSPGIDYNISQDPLAILCCQNGHVDRKDLSWYLQFGNPIVDSIAEEDTLVNHYCTLADEIVYGDQQTLQSAKSLLSAMKESPYTDIYLKYDVERYNRFGNFGFILKDPVSLSNKFFNLVTDKASTHWLDTIRMSLEHFFYDLITEKPTIHVRQVEVILRDYQVLLVLETDELRILYIFDLILLTSITESIMYSTSITEEPYYKKENGIWQ